MIEMLKAPDHVVAAKLTGTLGAEDYGRMIAEVGARLARFEKIGLMVDLTGFHDVTLEAAAKDIGYSFGKIMEWRRFPREAIVTDKQWVKGLAKMVGPLIPFIEVKTFDPGDDVAALAWAADIEVKPKG